MLVVFMDANLLFIDGQIRQPGIDPASGVVVINSVFSDVKRLVRMPAKNALRLVLPRVFERPGGNFWRHAQPACIQPVDQPHDGLALEVELLQLEIQCSPNFTEPHIVDLEAIELMPMNGNVAVSAQLPLVALVNADSDQMRHNVRQSVIVIAFDPDNLDVAFGIRELADETEELPMIFGEAGEVEVGKNVAQQDQPLKTVFLQHPRGLARVTGFRPQMQVGKDQRVVDMQIHTSIVAIEC